MSIDSEYWEMRMKPDGNSDPLAIALSRLKAFQDFAEVANEMIPALIETLEEGRESIVKQTEKSFADIYSLLDQFEKDGEASLSTAQRVCDHYRKTAL